MNLLFDLPAAQRGAFTPADGEEIKYCSPCDIDREGKLPQGAGGDRGCKGRRA